MDGNRVAREGVDRKDVEVLAPALFQLPFQDEARVAERDLDPGRAVLQIGEARSRPRREPEDVRIDLVEAHGVAGLSIPRDRCHTEAHYAGAEAPGGRIGRGAAWMVEDREPHAALLCVIR